MGVQLTDTLRRLCDVIGWSYAVFWRPITRNNHLNLVWGDGYCELAQGGSNMSGFEAMDLLLKERAAEGQMPGAGFQVKDRVGLLVYKLMASEIHVVGDGIVGQAALTGNHQWILHNALSNCGSVSQALVAMNHQFSAGIQTIGIIPVLPHGVLQLGSIQMVMENKGFIDYLRGLFAELGTVPGALVSDASRKRPNQNIIQNASFEESSTGRQPADKGTYISGISSASLDRSHNQLLPYSRSVRQSICSLSRPSCMPTNSSNVSAMTATSIIMHVGDFTQSTIKPLDESIRHQGQPESGYLGSRPIYSKLAVTPMGDEVRDSNSASLLGFHNPSGLSCSGPAMLEERELMLDGCTTSHKYSDTDFLLGRSEPRSNLDDLGQGNSFSACTVSGQSQHSNSSSKEVRQILDPGDHSRNTDQMFHGDSELMVSTSIQKTGEVPIEGQWRNDYNAFQTLLESTQFEEQQSRHELLLGTPLDSWQSSSIPLQESKRSLSSVSAENHPSTSESPGAMGTDDSKNMESSPSPAMFTPGNGLINLLDDHNKSWVFNGCLDDVFVQGNKSNAHEMSSDVSTCINQLDMETVFDTLKEQIWNDQNCCNELFPQASTDQLLGAVVAKISSATMENFVDNASCKTSLTKNCLSSLHTSSTTSGWLGSSDKMPVSSVGISPMLVKSEVAGSGSVISECLVKKNGECSQKDGGYKSKISLWAEKCQNADHSSVSAAHGKRIDDIGKMNKKRSRPGENPRPRPKDRQMIQDRVKELREIVPNGAKCSIDALLEKTIKHMLFLQSVTKHADKLKEVGEPKIVSKEGGALLKDNFDGGATWAFEIGSQSMLCPIIVEDLNVPRQMLVEMLCEEQGLFLEIAELIRGLGLTILKGVLEARKDKVWARFTVEANRDVTRMEIFLSLVRLLEPNAGTSGVPQGVDNLHKQHNMFQPFSLRAAGLSDCL